MRESKEKRIWKTLKKERNGRPSQLVAIGTGQVELSVPCTVIGGRNGSGKSRMLRLLNDELGTDAVYLDMHHLTEQVLIVLRSREDAEEIADETGSMGPDTERLGDVGRIVGREYDAVEWYSLDLEPGDRTVAETLSWGGETSLVPFFRARYRGLDYSSLAMGLGELSVHLLFWILEQFRNRDRLVLLLDEPDAYLPPVGVSALVARLLRLCRQRDWSIILTSHSEELIEQAVDHEALIRLDLDSQGNMSLSHISDNERAAEPLLAKPPIDTVLFCEDESGLHLTRSLLGSTSRRILRSTSLVWGNGSGYMESLRKHLPRSPDPDVRFAFIMDGDKRGEVEESGVAEWPVFFLPGNDPDEGLRLLADYPEDLVRALPHDEESIRQLLLALEGLDPHDWVNGLASGDLRAAALKGLTELWCRKNPGDVDAFRREVLENLQRL